MKTISFKYIWVPLLISLTIFYLCCIFSVGISEDEIDWPIPVDKVVHFLMYFGLSGASSFNYIYIKSRKREKINMAKLLTGAFVIPIIYGGLIEIVQHHCFSLRTGDWWDFFADILGSLAVLPIALVFKKHLIRNKMK